MKEIIMPQLRQIWSLFILCVVLLVFPQYTNALDTFFQYPLNSTEYVAFSGENVFNTSIILPSDIGAFNETDYTLRSVIMRVRVETTEPSIYILGRHNMYDRRSIMITTSNSVEISNHSLTTIEIPSSIPIENTTGIYISEFDIEFSSHNLGGFPSFKALELYIFRSNASYMSYEETGILTDAILFNIDFSIECMMYDEVINIWTKDSKVCLQCPLGAICDETGHILPTNAYGYIPSHDNQYIFLQCIIPDACPEGTMECAEGYEGAECSACSVNYFHSNSNHCKECQTNAFTVWLIFTIAVGLLTMLLLWLAVKGAFALKILGVIFTFLQTFVEFSYIELNWTGSLITLFNSLALFRPNFRLLSLECSLPHNSTLVTQYAVKFFGFLVLPLFIVVILAIVSQFGGAYLYERVIKMNVVVTEEERKAAGVRRQTIFPPKKQKQKKNKKNKKNKDNKDDNSNIESSPPPLSREASGTRTPSIIRRQNMTNSESQIQVLRNPDGSLMSKEKAARLFVNRLVTDILIRAFTIFLAYAYFPLISENMSFFDCQKSSEGKYVLDSNPHLLCFSDWWTSMLPFASILLIMYGVGIPSYFIWALQQRPCLETDVQRYREIQQRVVFKDLILAEWFLGKRAFSDDEVDAFLRELDRWERRFSTLTLPYDPRYFYWEIVVMARKMCITITKVFFTSYPVFQATVVVMVLVFFLFLHSRYRPFSDKSVNRLQSIALSSSILTLMLGLMINSETNLRPFVTNILGNLAIVAIGIVVLYITYLVGKFSVRHWRYPNMLLNKRDPGREVTQEEGQRLREKQIKHNSLATPTKDALIITAHYTQEKLLEAIDYYLKNQSHSVSPAVEKQVLLCLNRAIAHALFKHKKDITEVVSKGKEINRLDDDSYSNHSTQPSELKRKHSTSSIATFAMGAFQSDPDIVSNIRQEELKKSGYRARVATMPYTWEDYAEFSQIRVDEEDDEYEEIHERELGLFPNEYDIELDRIDELDDEGSEASSTLGGHNNQHDNQQQEEDNKCNDINEEDETDNKNDDENNNSLEELRSITFHFQEDENKDEEERSKKT